MKAVYDWKSIRADWESGMAEAELLQHYGISARTLQRHIKDEGWTLPSGDIPDRPDSPAKHHLSRKAVMKQHREEWGKQRELSERAVDEQDLELAKLAKLSAEILKIRQEGERRAWGISDKSENDINGALVLTWRN